MKKKHLSFIQRPKRSKNLQFGAGVIVYTEIFIIVFQAAYKYQLSLYISQ